MEEEKHKTAREIQEHIEGRKISEEEWEEKLKTLKEIGGRNGSFMKSNDGFISEKELRAEAVKWVKELENIRVNHNIRGESSLTTDWSKIIEGRLETIEFIKHFFNLTEEDLA